MLSPEAVLLVGHPVWTLRLKRTEETSTWVSSPFTGQLRSWGWKRKHVSHGIFWSSPVCISQPCEWDAGKAILLIWVEASHLLNQKQTRADESGPACIWQIPHSTPSLEPPRHPDPSGCLTAHSPESQQGADFCFRCGCKQSHLWGNNPNPVCILHYPSGKETLSCKTYKNWFD